MPNASEPRRRCLLILTGCVLGIAALAAAAAPRTLGWLEWAWLEPGHIRLKAKLDSGAKTSSIDAVDIQTFERADKRWVRFRVPLSKRPEDSDRSDDLVLELPIAREIRIKDHDHESQPRYVVYLDFCVGNRALHIPVTLADRKQFNYPLLLGREALAGVALIDLARIFTAKRHCQADDSSRK